MDKETKAMRSECRVSFVKKIDALAKENPWAEMKRLGDQWRESMRLAQQARELEQKAHDEYMAFSEGVQEKADAWYQKIKNLQHANLAEWSLSNQLYRDAIDLLK